MYTAVILVCTNISMPTPNDCYTIMNQMFTETIEQCQYNTYEFVTSEVFGLIHGNPADGLRFDVADFYCINWTAKNI